MRQLNRWSSIRPPGKGFEQKGQRISAQSGDTTELRSTHCVTARHTHDRRRAHHIEHERCVWTSTLHRLTWQTREQMETQISRCECCILTLETERVMLTRASLNQNSLETLFDSMHHAKTVTRPGGRATARAMSGWDR